MKDELTPLQRQLLESLFVSERVDDIITRRAAAFNGLTALDYIKAGHFDLVYDMYQQTLAFDARFPFLPTLEELAEGGASGTQVSGQTEPNLPHE